MFRVADGEQGFRISVRTFRPRAFDVVGETHWDWRFQKCAYQPGREPLGENEVLKWPRAERVGPAERLMESVTDFTTEDIWSDRWRHSSSLAMLSDHPHSK